MSLLTDTADALVAALNNTSVFSQVFTAYRKLAPTFDLKEMADLHVVVAPRTDTRSWETRGEVRRTLKVDIAVAQKTVLDDEDGQDKVITLAEEIADWAQDQQITTDSHALAVQSVQNNPTASPQHLRELGQTTSVVSIEYLALTPV